MRRTDTWRYNVSACLEASSNACVLLRARRNTVPRFRLVNFRLDWYKRWKGSYPGDLCGCFYKHWHFIKRIDLTHPLVWQVRTGKLMCRHVTETVKNTQCKLLLSNLNLFKTYTIISFEISNLQFSILKGQANYEKKKPKAKNKATLTTTASLSHKS